MFCLDILFVFCLYILVSIFVFLLGGLCLLFRERERIWSCENGKVGEGKGDQNTMYENTFFNIKANQTQ